MKFCAVFVFTIVLLAGKCRAGDDSDESGSDQDESIFKEARRYMGECAEKIKIVEGVCNDMMDENADRGDPKYDNCKAMGVCVCERFGIMVGNDYDFAKLEVLKKRFNKQEYKTAAEKALKPCGGVSVGPSQNESVVNIASCAFKASPKFKEIVTNMAKSFSSSD